MILFIIALLSEAKCLFDKIKNLKEIPFLDKTYYEGELEDKKVVIAISGIGKVSAALTTQYLIDKYKPKTVFNFGLCGGVDNSVEILNYYLIESTCQFDFDVTEIDDVPLGYIQEYDRVYFDTTVPKNISLKKVKLASADRFSNKKEDIENIIKMGCSVRDMEGSAIAQVCVSNKIPLIMVKGITDIYGNPPAQYMENKEKVCKGFSKIISEILTKI